MDGQVGPSVQERFLDGSHEGAHFAQLAQGGGPVAVAEGRDLDEFHLVDAGAGPDHFGHAMGLGQGQPDRKSTRLNSSHVKISYAVFCLKKKKTHTYAEILSTHV